MPLSINSPITLNDIQYIGMHKRDKVFWIEGQNNDKLVIKYEGVSDLQIKSANAMIKAVDPGVRVKILTRAEMQALRDFVKNWEDIWDYFDELKRQGCPVNAPDGSREAILSLKRALDMSVKYQDSFYKMGSQEIRDLGGALNKRIDGDKSELKAFLAVLTQPGGLERLGQVVAVDLFNGNSDRLFPNRTDVQTIGGISFNFKTVANIGNVFTVLSGGGFKVSALDFIAPNSEFKDHNQPLANQESGDPADNDSQYNGQWPGKLLVDRKARQKFAKDIVDDLEMIFHPKKHKLSLKKKLPFNAAKRIDNGMVAGAQSLKRRLEAKYNPNRWTPGATERYQLMCQVS